jgi:hypothetical protein
MTMRKMSRWATVAAAVTGAWCCALALTGAAEVAAPAEPQDLPMMILDESAPRWRIDRFIGNKSAGPYLMQGSARQAGGIAGFGGSGLAFPGDGTCFVSYGEFISLVRADGTARVVAGGGASLADGPAEEAKIVARPMAGCVMCYSAVEKNLYFVDAVLPVVRRLYKQPDGRWMVQRVAGDPEKTGTADGPGGEARFASILGICVTESGIIYLNDNGYLLRKIEKGAVSTVVRFKPNSPDYDGPLPLAEAGLGGVPGTNTGCKSMSLGETDDILYIGDHAHTAIRRIDLKAGTITKVAGMRAPQWVPPAQRSPRDRRNGQNADGPALTWASANSGTTVTLYDRVHRAVWWGGPDEQWARWIKDGWSRTAVPFGAGSFNQEGMGMKPEKCGFVWTTPRAVDADGNVYFGSARTYGLFKAYQVKEGGK